MNISVIIPIHEHNDELSLYLDKAVESIAKQESVDELPQLVLVFPPELEAAIEGFKEGTIRKLFAKSIAANAVHGSDSDENAEIEANFFFSQLERF